MTFNRLEKQEARVAMEALVAAYANQEDFVTQPSSRYNEAAARNEFIDRFLIILGWDVLNDAHQLQVRREVVVERSSDTETAVIGRPDYRLRVNGADRMPVEAKKPSVRISSSDSSALQARSYGWSLSLPAATLTNFHETLIYDTTVTPQEGDRASVALIPGCRFHYTEYVERFDELWEKLSYEVVASDRFDEVYQYSTPPRGDSAFDRTFLEEFRRWRLLFSADIAQQNPALNAAEVGRRTQRLLNALLFLRVCEDRNIARYEALLESASSHEVRQAFRRADAVFNAGLFTVLDGATSVSDDVLSLVIREMYWPKTKFAFGVLEPGILAELYEQYLAERVEVSEVRETRLVQKPELVHAGGVATTPDWIVDELIDGGMGPLLNALGTVPDDFTVLDPACGSGIFLVSVLQRLIAQKELRGQPTTAAERGQLVINHVYGMDIDGEAVEVARLSILLVVLGEEHLDITHTERLLPDLSANIVVGNSIVSDDFDRLLPEPARIAERRAAVMPTNLEAAFARPMRRGGFSLVVGNPPYIRIQTLAEFMPDQLAYFQDARSGYKSSQAHNFDVYLLFIERALRLLATNGRLAFIIPNRFTSLLAAAPVRTLLGPRIERLVHFGVNQIFHDRTTYTALIFVGAETTADAQIEMVHDLELWREDNANAVSRVDRSRLDGTPWTIASDEWSEIFNLMNKNKAALLGDKGWVDIFVGTQTSKDDVFYVSTDGVINDDGLITVQDSQGESWRLEPDILRPAVKKQKIEPYDRDLVPDKYGIFPYAIERSSSGRKPYKARLYSRMEMYEKFPYAYHYLLLHREALLARNIQPGGQEWWAYGRSQSLTELTEPKIIVRVMSLTPCLALDDEALLVPGGGDGGPYYLMRPMPECTYTREVVVAIMSHPAVDAHIASHGKLYRGSYVIHTKRFMAQIPLPRLTEEEISSITRDVSEITGITSRLRSEGDSVVAASLLARKSLLRQEVEKIISLAYGFEAHHMESLEG